MPISRSRRLFVASLAGALAIPALATSDQAGKASTEKAKCYGVNKCKGTGDCNGPGHSCKGHNSCKTQGYVEMDKDTCLRINGGRLTAEAEKAPAAKKKAPQKKGD